MTLVIRSLIIYNQCERPSNSSLHVMQVSFYVMFWKLQICLSVPSLDLLYSNIIVFSNQQMFQPLFLYEQSHCQCPFHKKELVKSCRIILISYLFPLNWSMYEVVLRPVPNGKHQETVIELYVRLKSMSRWHDNRKKGTFVCLWFAAGNFQISIDLHILNRFQRPFIVLHSHSGIRSQVVLLFDHSAFEGVSFWDKILMSLSRYNCVLDLELSPYYGMDG